jgi:DNA-binding NarL/FixJ family response regulator
MSVKILIVDDHPMVLEGLKSLLADSEGAKWSVLLPMR